MVSIDMHYAMELILTCNNCQNDDLDYAEHTSRDDDDQDGDSVGDDDVDETDQDGQDDDHGNDNEDDLGGAS